MLEKGFSNPTDRVVRLRNMILTAKPYVESERAVLATEAYKETEQLPAIMRRAKVVEKIFNQLPVTIRPDELIVGAVTINPRSTEICPEFSYDWVEKEFETMEHRIAEMLARGIENREYWHKARHISKRNFHIMNMANRLYPNCFSQDQIQEMRQTEKLIGKWHDLVVITDFCDSHQIALSEAHLQEFELSENQIFSKAILKN